MQVLPPDEHGLREALALLRDGQVIAFPTDTVYGVGADGLSAEAVSRLYAIKDRPYSQAIPLLIGAIEELGQVAASVPAQAYRLAERYWPGALTLVLPAATALPAVLLAGGSSVAVRLPDHAFVRKICLELGRPLAATSANLHGAPNPRDAGQVARELQGRLPLLIDGGPTPGDIPSTIVDLSGAAPRVLREGVIPAAAILELLD